MPRELAADRRNRLAREQKELDEKLEKTYPARLMKALERVSNSGRFVLSVVQSAVADMPSFKVTDPNLDWRDPVFLDYTYTNQSNYELNDLEGWLDSHENDQREAARRLELRRTAQEKALATFTAEEREVLGLHV